MTNHTKTATIALVAVAAISASATIAARETTSLSFRQEQVFQDTFKVDLSDLETTGNNPYFPLEPGLKLEYKGGDTHLVFTVLNETEVIDGVKCRVIEERETKSGKLVEISRNFFVNDKKTNDVYYFGEDVDNYKDGKIVNHDSAWRSGVDKATFGLFMPGVPKVGQAFYQEIAPGVALDRINIVSVTEQVDTPAGKFAGCVKFEETTPLEPTVTDYKRYASGIGMVQDGGMKLVKKPRK